MQPRGTHSRQIGALVGPTIVAIVASEFPMVQPHLYDAQIPPVVYLSGTLFFVGGLAVVRAHNIWTTKWPVLVTLSGWLSLVLGLVRMFAASQYRQAYAAHTPAFFMIMEGLLLLAGVTITFESYRRSGA